MSEASEAVLKASRAALEAALSSAKEYERGYNDAMAMRDAEKASPVVTNDMTGQERLKAIRERAEAATPGPWFESGKVAGISEDGEWDHSYQDDIVALGDVNDSSEYNRYPAVVSSWGYDADGVTCSDENRRFIAHAREDIPFLLDLIESQQRKIEALAKPMTPAEVIAAFSYMQGHQICLMVVEEAFDAIIAKRAAESKA